MNEIKKMSDPLNRRVMDKTDNALIIDQASVINRDIGKVLQLIKKAGTQYIFNEEYSQCAEMSIAQLLLYINDNIELDDITDMIIDGYVVDCTIDEIVETSPVADIVDAMFKVPNVNWFTVTEKGNLYKAFGKETVIKGPINPESILYLAKKHDITTFIISDIDLMVELMKSTTQKTFLTCKTRGMYTDARMIQFKHDKIISHLEITNQHEIGFYYPFNRFKHEPVKENI